MMHRNDFVVSIRPAGGGKAFREYKIDGQEDNSDTRARRISIPFNQEYEFVFKNMKDCRRSVKITIDGDVIGNWVVSSGNHTNPYETVLERFMDSDKRFKILHSDDGGVSDPSSPDNGKVIVEVTDEYQPPRQRKKFGLLNTRPGVRSARRGAGGSALRGASLDDGRPRGSSGDVTLSASVSSCANYSCDSIPVVGREISADLDIESNVATGEGSASQQTFTTTHWRGSFGSPMFFIFVFKGVDRNIVDQRVGFCTECGTSLTEHAKFCHKCGTKVTVAV